jgi:predicted polyphosphate/ATP-dependent NAD kinase
MKKIGLIINPISGMGGAVGLKGTDGKEILAKAISLGAKPVAFKKAETFLKYLKHLKNRIELLVGFNMMGENEAKKIGYEYKVLGKPKEFTTSQETKEIVKLMLKNKVELIVFCGGDGTARDIMDITDMKCPILGIPTGVKMHSSVFAVNAESGAKIIEYYILGSVFFKESEVMDIDEKAFRQGKISAKLYGYVIIPYVGELIQNIKIASPIVRSELENQAAIALYVIEELLKPNMTFILGPGSTTRVIADLLEEKKTLLGVDLLRNKKIIYNDVNEKQILANITLENAKIIITPIGGQGFIFGRGNQQISSSVIKKVRKENIIVLATKSKLRDIKVLRVDTGDQELDNDFLGKISVIIDYKERCLMPIK